MPLDLEPILDLEPVSDEPAPLALEPIDEPQPRSRADYFSTPVTPESTDLTARDVQDAVNAREAAVRDITRPASFLSRGAKRVASALGDPVLPILNTAGKAIAAGASDAIVNAAETYGIIDPETAAQNRVNGDYFSNVHAYQNDQPLPLTKAIELSKEEARSRDEVPVAGIAADFGQGVLKDLPKFAALHGVGVVTAGAGKLAQLLSASAASAGLFGYDEQGNFSPTKAAVMAALPGVSRIGETAAVSALGKAGVELESAAATEAVKRAGSALAQQAFFNATSIPEYAKATPQQRWEIFASNLSNLGFEIPGVVKLFRSAKAERDFKDAFNDEVAQANPVGTEEQPAPVEESAPVQQASGNRFQRPVLPERSQEEYDAMVERADALAAKQPAKEDAAPTDVFAAQARAALDSNTVIGRGGNATVYDIPGTDFVLRVANGSDRKIKAPFLPVEDRFDGKNFGQPVAEHNGMQVLRRQTGTPAGLARPDQVQFGKTKESQAAAKIANDAKYEAAITLAANMPQSAYDQFAEDLSTINGVEGKGAQFDPSKSNNVLIDPVNGRFNIVDVNESPGKYKSGLSDMLITLIGNTYAGSYKGATDLKPLYQQIYTKAKSAAEKAGVPLELGSSGKYSEQLAGGPTAALPATKAPADSELKALSAAEAADAPMTAKQKKRLKELMASAPVELPNEAAGKATRATGNAGGKPVEPVAPVDLNAPASRDVAATSNANQIRTELADVQRQLAEFPKPKNIDELTEKNKLSQRAQVLQEALEQSVGITDKASMTAEQVAKAKATPVQRTAEDVRKDLLSITLDKRTGFQSDSFAPEGLIVKQADLSVLTGGKPVFHETSLESAYKLVPELKKQLKRSWTSFFVSDNPDLALGQGGKNGVLLEIDPTRVNGWRHEKPGTSDLTGYEYWVDKTVAGGLNAITFKSKRQLDAFQKRYPKTFNYEAVTETDRGVRLPVKGKEQTNEVLPKPTDSVGRTLDTSGTAAFGAAFDDRIGEIDPVEKSGDAPFLKRVLDGKGSDDKDPANSKRTLVVRNNETGELREVSVWDNNGAKIVDPAGKTKAGKDALKILRTFSKVEGVTLKYTPVASLRYSEFQKGINRPVTADELAALKQEHGQAVGPTEVGKAAVSGVDEEGNATKDVVDPSVGAPQPEPLSELESWLRAKLQDKKTGKLKPIQPDDALDLANDFAVTEPESALEIAVELGTPLAKDPAFVALSRDAQREAVRKLFASRIYELVRRQYEGQTRAIEQGDRQGAGPAIAEPAIAVASKVQGEQPTSSAAAPVEQPAASGASADSAKVLTPNILERADAKLAALQAQIRSGKSFTGITGIEPVIYDAALTVGRGILKTTNSVVKAVRAVIAEIKRLKPDAVFDEEALAVQLESELARDTTQVSGNDVGILSKSKSPSLDEQIAYTQKVFSDYGLPVERVDKVDTRAPGNPVKTQFRFKPDGTNRDAEALRLADDLESQIAGGDQATKLRLSNLTTSIANSVANGDASVIGSDGKQMISDSVQQRLFNLAQTPASEAGQLLASRGHSSFDPEGELQMARNVGVNLRNIWSKAVGGDQIAAVMDKITATFRSYFTPEIVQSVLAPLKLDPRIVAAVTDLISQPQPDISRIENDISLRLQRDFAFSKDQATRTAREIFKALDKTFASATDRALKAVQEGLVGEQKKVFKRGGSLWEALSRSVKAGMFDPGVALEKIAAGLGYTTPTPTQKAQIKAWVEREEFLRTPTQRQIVDAGGDVLKATKKAEIATESERLDLIRKIQANWGRWSKPVKFTKWLANNPDIARNNAQAVNEFVAANLLFTATFAARQSIDVGVVSMPLNAVNRTLAHVLERASNDGGFSVETIKDLGTATKEMLASRIASFKATARQAANIALGHASRKVLERTTHNVAIFERANSRADELEANGNKAAATAIRLSTIFRAGYRTAELWDSIQSTGLEWQEMRQQLTTELRKMGKTRAAIASQADEIFSLTRLDVEQAKAEASLIGTERGLTKSNRQLALDADNLLKARAYDRMSEATNGKIDFQAENDVMRELHSWNLPETGGIGGVIAETIKGIKSKTEAKGIPTGGLFSFGNAMGIAAGRMATFSGGGLLGGWGFGDSPWYRGERNIRQRRIEAVQGLSAIGIMIGLAAAGKILIQTKYPKDKDEKERFIAGGHKLNSIRFLNDDGGWFEVPISMTPFSYIASPLYMIGGVQMLLSDQKREQDKLNAEALRTGAIAGQAKSIGPGDVMGVLAQGAYGMLTGGRTSSGAVQAFSDYGDFKLNKAVVGLTSPYIPALPAWNGVARIMGAAVDTRTATLLELLVPSPWSPHQRVNSLGDPLVNPNSSVRLLQVLSGGVGYGNESELESNHAYRQLFTAGYAAPEIAPNKGYNFNGTIRPMQGDELDRYAVARARAFKDELQGVNVDGLPEEQARSVVAQAFTRANSRALSDIGVTVGSGSSGSSGGNVIPAPGNTAGLQAQARSGIGSGGIGVASGFGGAGRGGIGGGSRLGLGGGSRRIRASAGSLRPVSTGSRLRSVKLPSIKAPSVTRVLKAPVKFRRAVKGGRNRLRSS